MLIFENKYFNFFKKIMRVSKINVIVFLLVGVFLLFNNVNAVCIDNGISVDYEPNETADAFDHCVGDVLIDYSCDTDNGVKTSQVDCDPNNNHFGYCKINRCYEHSYEPNIFLEVNTNTNTFKVGESIPLAYSVNLGCVDYACSFQQANKCDIIISGPESGTKSVASANSKTNRYGISMMHYTAGSYTYTLKCSNSYEESTSSVSVTVEGGADGGPVATILSPAEGTVVTAGESVTFNGAGAGVGGMYKWCNGTSCGCGSVVLSDGSSNTITRTFREPAYSWNRTCLVVTDAQGNVSTKTASVSVVITRNSSCHNGIKDGDEYGIDCGGSICSLCNVDLSGALNLSAVCDANGSMKIDWSAVPNADRYELRIKARELGICASPNVQKELTALNYSWKGLANESYLIGVGAIAENGQEDIYGEREVIEVVCDGSGSDDGDDGDGDGDDGDDDGDDGDDDGDGDNENDGDVLRAIINNPEGSVQYIEAGGSINFSGVGIDINGKDIVAYEWRLDDCSNGELVNSNSRFNKDFSTVENYKLYLRVKNSDGVWSDNCPSKKVYVSQDNSCPNEGEKCGADKKCCSDLLCNSNGICEKEEYRGNEPIKFRR